MPIGAGLPSATDNAPDDFALMRGISARDESALAALYDSYSPLVYTLLMRILHNRADADELLTDIFYEVWQQANRFDESRGCPRVYLVTLARSRAIDRLRTRMRLPETSRVPESTPAAESINSEDREYAGIIRSA